jgi:adenylate cyclase
MSEKLTPEQVVAILNRYLELTSSSIFKFGGTLDKFIGDATMAIFGAPLPMEDYVFKAVCAANDMVERSHDLARELEEQFGRSVSFGVGVHCGKAVVGNIGTTRRMDYTAIGDTVNTSARLEANAPADTVYISKKVVDILQDRIECESVGNIPLKGKSEELEVFRLISINDEHPE